MFDFCLARLIGQCILITLCFLSRVGRRSDGFGGRPALSCFMRSGKPVVTVFFFSVWGAIHLARSRIFGIKILSHTISLWVFFFFFKFIYVVSFGIPN